MPNRKLLNVILFTLAATLLCAAQNITGTVTNATTGKPAAGADVSLVDPMQGMAEVTSAKTDAAGKFALQTPGPAQGPRLVRVSHQGVNYFKMVTPGTTSVDAQIYDSAKKVDGITGTVLVTRLQAQQGTLQMIELYAVKNGSTPPRTLQSDNTFEIALPPGAKISGADAQGPNGQPIQTTPNPVGEKDHYAFSYPLKPGETRFQVAYELPYNGQATISPRLLRNYDHFVLVMPQSIKWEPKDAAAFKPMQDQPGTTVQVAASAKAGQNLSFTISGTGTIQDQADTQGAQAEGGAMGAQDNRPGGGLGAPIDAPDALEKYRWVILAALAMVLTFGAYYTMHKTAQDRLANNTAAQPEEAVTAPAASAPAARSTGNTLLEAMKEELFQLEIERQNGQISPEEYAKTKAALDQTLARALSRGSRGQGA